MTKIREVKLLKTVETLDNLNQPTTTTQTKDIVAELRSVSRSEYFQGRQGGLVPDLSFLVSVFDYDGEKIVEYNGTRYAIYRTYEADDNYVELYGQVEGGITNHTTPDPTPTPDPDDGEGGDGE